MERRGTNYIRLHVAMPWFFLDGLSVLSESQPSVVNPTLTQTSVSAMQKNRASIVNQTVTVDVETSNVFRFGHAISQTTMMSAKSGI